MSPATRYRRVRVRLWIEPLFRKLTDGEKLVAVYLLSGPQTSSVGLCRVSIATAAEDLAMSIPQFRRRFDVVLRAFRWRHEADSSLLWIPEWIEENAPQNPNIVRAWRTAFNEIPDGPLKAEAAAATVAFLKAKGQAFRDAFGDVILESVQESMDEPFGNDSPNTPDPDPERANRIANHNARRLANAAHTRQVVSQLRQQGR